MDSSTAEYAAESTSHGKLIDPSDVARLVAVLASSKSAAINGETFKRARGYGGCHQLLKADRCGALETAYGNRLSIWSASG
jgi:hypothetical protein